MFPIQNYIQKASSARLIMFGLVRSTRGILKEWLKPDSLVRLALSKGVEAFFCILCHKVEGHALGRSGSQCAAPR